MIYTDETVIPFGKHQGKILKDVPADYLLWAMIISLPYMMVLKNI